MNKNTEELGRLRTEKSNRHVEDPFLKRLFFMFLGQWIAMLGIDFLVHAYLGLGPWELLAMAVSYHTPFSFGIASNVLGATALIIGLLLKGKMGVETITDIFVTGLMLDAWNLLLDGLPIPWESWSMPMKLILILVGALIYAFGTYVVMSQGLGCGPRDTLMVGVGNLMPRVPIGAVNGGIMLVVFLLGWQLGGPVGIGSALCLVAMSGMLQLVCHLMNFEPRAVRHENFLQTIRGLRK